jgi:ABC-type sugar transport system ATPase subunit
MSLETVVEEVKQEVVKVAEEVKAEVVKVEKAATVSITADEKLVLADAELEYLKATGQIQQFQKTTEAKAKEYQAAVEGFLNKYGLSKLEYVFDGVKREFQLIAKKA